MAVNIVVEDLGGAEEGVFAVWLKNVGDHVAAGEAVAEVMTDKVNLEVVAAEDGVLHSTAVDEEDQVRIGQVIGTLAGAAA